VNVENAVNALIEDVEKEANEVIVSVPTVANEENDLHATKKAKHASLLVWVNEMV
jgi:hypothetical protein